MERTVKDVFDTMSDEMKTSLYASVGYMLEFGYFDINEWAKLKAVCDDCQLKVCRYLIEKAREVYK